MEAEHRAVRRSRGQWRALIARGEGSALGVAGFCRREGISTASFYTWRKRLAADAGVGAQASPPTFIEVGTLGGEAGSRGVWDIELELGAGVVLRLRRG